MFPMPIEKTRPATQRLYKVAVPTALVVWMLPILAVLITANRSMSEIQESKYWTIPEAFNLFSNFAEVFQATPMGLYMVNSAIVSIATVIGALALATLAGFSLAKFRFRGNILLFALFIAGNFIPFQILMVPVRDLMLSLGMYDTVYSLITFHIAFQTGFCVLFMRNFIAMLPNELIEAGRADGANEWQIFWHIVLPLVRPALAALAVLVFTFIWNDYFWALVLVQSDDAMPVTAGIQQLQGQYVARWHLISAAALLAALPPVVLFFFLQRHFIAGLTMGAVKG